MRGIAALRSAGILDGLWTAAASAGGKLQALALLAVAGTIGGIEATGIVVLVTSAAILVVSIIDAGLTPQASRLYANRTIQGRKAVLRPFAWRAAAHVPAGLLTFSLLVWFTTGISTPAWWAVAQVAYGLTYHAAYTATGVAYGNFRFRRGALVNALVRLGTVPLLLGVAAADLPIYVLLMVLAAGEVVIAVIQYFIAAQRHGTADASWLRLARTWRYGVGPIANTLMNKSDTVIVAAALSATSLGIYAVASQVQNAATTLAMIPAGALVVHVARAGRGSQATRSYRTTAKVVGLTYCLLAIPLMVAPEFFVELLLRVDLANSLPLRICLMAGLLSVLGGVQMQHLTGLGEERAIVLVWVSAASVSVLAMLPLAFAYGPVGAACGALARDTYFFLATRYFIKRVPQEGAARS